MAQDCCTERGAIRVESASQRKSDALTAATWGVGLLWGGLVWLAHETGALAAAHMPISSGALFFLGIGLVFATAIAITLLVPGYRAADFSAYILCAGAIGLGLSGWTPVWPVVIIVLGAVLVAQSIMRLRSGAN
jgi:hypothetical protein